MPAHGRPLTLCYHAISARWQDQLAVTPDAIAQQVRSLLRRGFTPVTAEGILQGDPGTFHVTFDDGYRNIRNALDMLRSLGVPATVFVCSSLAASGARLEVPELDGRATGCEHELDTMRWDDLRELVGDGVEIGSHTRSHAHLPELDEAAMLAELVGSRERIEEAVGAPCRFLAYPYGENDARVRAVAREARYLAAFGLDESTRVLDPFALPRTEVYRRDSGARFLLKTSRAAVGLRWAANTVRRMRA